MGLLVTSIQGVRPVVVGNKERDCVLNALCGVRDLRAVARLLRENFGRETPHYLTDEERALRVTATTSVGSVVLTQQMADGRE
jgi:hypothetical protein